MKILIFLLSITLLSLVGYFGYQHLTFDYTIKPAAKNVYVPPIQDPGLLSELQSLKATHISDIELRYDDPNAVATQKGSYKNKVLTVESSVSDEEEIRTLAHEYLHHVWYTVMTFKEHVNLSDRLTILLANDKDMQTRVSPYTETRTLNASELFSIYCTESTDSYMLSIVDECNKYIDRSKLVLTR